MRYALAALLAVLAPVVASAVPICTTNTMAGYVLLGSGGCQLGDYVFSNFTYNYNLSNADSPAYFQGLGDTGPYPDVFAADVTVTPDVVGPGVVNLGIGNASWVVGGWQKATLTITFDVNMLANQLKAVSAGFTGSLDGIGSESVFGSVNPPNAATNFVTNAPSGGGSGVYVYPTVPASYPVNMKLQASLFSNTSLSCIVGGVDLCDGAHDDEAIDYITGVAYNNGAHLSDLNARFSQSTDFNPPPGTPEPGTWLLVGAGVGLAGFLKRRRAV